VSPGRRADAKLSLVLPAYDEAERLPRTLEAFLAYLPDDPALTELVVVDDGSTDATGELAEQVAARDQRVRVLRTGVNRGKGAAVRRGMLAAGGDLLVFTDADGSYGPGQVERIARALVEAPVAIGVRRAELLGGRSAGGSARLVRQVASRAFNLAQRSVLGLPFADTQCGLKGFRRDAARAIFGRAALDGFAFDAEALFLALRLGLGVVEVPVRAEERDGSKVRLALDAVRMLREMRQVRRAAARGAYDAEPTLPAPGEVTPPMGL
jgi:glycosyltransferase involved in cell wall biosynthesis